MAFARRVLGSIALCMLAAIPGCGGSDEDESNLDDLPLKAYWADAKKLDLSDLTRVAAGYATDGLNSSLRLGPVSATFDAPTVFAAQAEPSTILPGNAKVKGIDQIVSGLAADFGERELGTQVNAIRLRHLQAGDDKYFVESAFTLRGGLAGGWNFTAGMPNGVGVNLGLNVGADVSSRIIVASTKDNVVKVLTTPLAAAADIRGFVLPRSIDDVQKMRPGEMFALRGAGHLGANLGLGVPVLFQTSGVYNIVASVGVSAVIAGQIDVQLVRLEGDEVVVDVGIENGKALSLSAGISDSFGIKGICDDGISCLRPVEVAGQKVDITQMVANAIDREVNKYLTFSISASAGRSSSRVSVSRLRFHLDRGNRAEVSRALEHALRFDVRLAQAMYNRDLGNPTPAVVAEFDAVRASTTSTRNFGFELFGMNMYHRAVVDKEGTFTVQTPEGVKTVLFDSVSKHSGFFQMDHGFTRIGVGAQTLDARNPLNFRSEANLFLQTAVSDKRMGNDLIIDNIDATLLAIVGSKGIEAIDPFGNRLQQAVWEHCRVQADDDFQTESLDEQCNKDLLDDPYIKSLHDIGMSKLEPFLVGFPADYQALARKAAEARLILQSVGIHNLDLANGPSVSFTVDARFDDTALGILTNQSKEQYRHALREYLTAVYADRMKIGISMDKSAVRAEVDRKWGTRMDEMATIFADTSAAYRRVAAAENKIPAALAGKAFSGSPLGVRFSVDHEQQRSYERAEMVSTSQERALAAARLFDALRDRAGKINAPLYTEHTTTFPLLSLVPRENLQVGVDFRTDTRSNFWNDHSRFQKAGLVSFGAAAKGSKVSTISAGMFDLDAILAGN
ncbi:MAG: hypothetical protein U0174_28465 [Polyangiaceae bacterium]